MSAASEPMRLRCLAGGAAPADVGGAAARASRLTPSAVGGLDRVLRACLSSPIGEELGRELSRFCVEHELAEADLAHVIRAAKFLIREASAADLGPEDFDADAKALLGDADALIALLRGEYQALRPALRRDLLASALEKHGNVLVDVDWRVDVVTTERNALRLVTPVALVTLAYRDARRDDRLTLQLTADQLERLQQIFATLAHRTVRPIAETS